MFSLTGGEENHFQECLSENISWKTALLSKAAKDEQRWNWQDEGETEPVRKTWWEGHTRLVPTRQALYSVCHIMGTTKQRACNAPARNTDLTRQAVSSEGNHSRFLK